MLYVLLSFGKMILTTNVKQKSSKSIINWEQIAKAEDTLHNIKKCIDSN